MRFAANFIGSIILEMHSFMYISIDKTAKRTYTKQIYYALRQKILSGELAVGEALPPYRELSRELAVSKNTVLAAYDMLASDGVVRGVAGSGFYVETGMERLPAAAPTAEHQSAALSDTVIPEGTVNFDNGLPALELFPRAKWNKAVSAALMYAPDSALGYDQPQGRSELRSVLCDYLRRIQGINCGSEQIIITSGAKQAISLAAGLLLAGGGEAWIEDPSTVILKRMLASNTERIVPLPVDEYGLDPESFPDSGKPALIFAAPSRQFPMGGIMPMARRIELIRRARSAGAYVIEDNFENEFRYDAPPAASLFELDPESVISVGTFSKVLFPSVRLGYMVVPKKLVPAICERKRLSDHHTNSVYQLALASFIGSGGLERHIRRMNREYRARRDHLTACIEAVFRGRVRLIGGAAGMNLIAEFPGVDFSEDMTRRLLDCGVYAVPVEQETLVKGRHTGQLILRYSGLTPEKLSLGAARLKEALG